jgi:hypothetical protein
MNTAQAKVRRNKIIDIKARINELNRARPYLKQEYYIARLEDMELALQDLKQIIKKEEKVILDNDHEIEQYIVMYE